MIMKQAVWVCSIAILWLQELILRSTLVLSATLPALGPTVSILSLASGRATKYTWAVETATYPSGLSLKVGTYVGNLVISTNFTRTAAGNLGVVSGSIVVNNPRNSSLRLSHVQVLVHQPSAGLAPVTSIAECSLSNDGYVVLDPQQFTTCPFAVLLPGGSTAPAVVVGQAMVLGGLLVSSNPMTAMFSSAEVMAVGKCAVLSDTFMSGQLYLLPDSIAAGSKLPSLGSAKAVCSTTRSLYRVTFGPYSTSMTCGAYKVVNTARANPLGGNAVPVMASSPVLVQITNCPAPASAPASPSPPPLQQGATPSTPVYRSSGAVTSTIVLGPVAASPSPVYVPPAAPVPPAATPASTDAYYYTYEYEATVPTGRRRLQQYIDTDDDGAPADVQLVNTASSNSHTSLQLSTGSMIKKGGKTGSALTNESLVPLLADQQVHRRREQDDLYPTQQHHYQQQQQQQPDNQLPQLSADQHVLSAQSQQSGQQTVAYNQLLIAATHTYPEQLPPTATRDKQSPDAVGIDWQHLQDAMQFGYGFDRGMWEQGSTSTGSPAIAATLSPRQLQQTDEHTSANGGSVDHNSTQQLLDMGHPLANHQAEPQELGAQQQNKQADALQPQPSASDASPGVVAMAYSQPGRHAEESRAWVAMPREDSSSRLQRPSSRQLQQQEPPTESLGTQQQQQQAMSAMIEAIVGSRQGQWALRGLRRSLQQATPVPGSGSAYYATAATDASKPSIALSNMKLNVGVVSYSWQPKVSVTPTAVSVPLSGTATLQYNIKVQRSELPPRTLLRGSVVLKNPLASPLRLSEVAVEAPAVGQVAWAYTSAVCSSGNSGVSSTLGFVASIVTVPANGQMVCSFVLSYPASAPAAAVVYARAVTEAGAELVSSAFKFTRPAAPPTATQALKLGACVVFTDTFITNANSSTVLVPSQLPSSGTKAPGAATAVVRSGKGGVLLCNSTTFEYSAVLGPYKPGQCGSFKVASVLRVRLINSSILDTSTAVSSVAVDITGCSPVISLAAANPVSAAAVSNDGSTYSNIGANGADLALPTVMLQPVEVSPVTSYLWSVKNNPVVRSIQLPYKQQLRTGFMVQYKRSAAPPGVTISGTVTVRNPNLLDPVQLSQIQVELYQLEGTGAVSRAYAFCPRDDSGSVSVTGHMVSSGSIICSWRMELLASGPAGSLIAGANSHLIATVVTSTGREAVSQTVPLNRVPVGSSATPAGTCAALSNTFQHVGLGGEQLLLPGISAIAAAGSTSGLLPGEAGGGRAADVVCDSLTLSYNAVYGPVTANECGVYKTINLAIASPTSGKGHQYLAAATGNASIKFTGCPGTAASLRITTMQLQLVRATVWNITSQSSVAPGSIIKASVSSTTSIAYGLQYLATAAAPSRQMVGVVTIQNTGQAVLQMQQLWVDVSPTGKSSPLQSSAVSWKANCPGSSIIGNTSSLAGNSTIRCSFSGFVPDRLKATADVVARVQLADGSEAASPAATFDFSKTPSTVVSTAKCAVVQDQFLAGADLLQPSRTSRPTAAAAPVQICNSQSVSYVATFGPFTKAQCGQTLGVVIVARVSPVTMNAVQLPVSVANVIGVNVTGGCAKPQ